MSAEPILPICPAAVPALPVAVEGSRAAETGGRKACNAAPRPHLLDAALAYARRGWSVIPTAAKKALGPWKRYQATRPDEATLRRLFGRPGITGLAVLFGSASGGLVCRDFDRLLSYQSWAAAHPDLAAALPTVATARGRHVYFRGPEGFADLGDGEYRGTSGHYCLLPPSAHPDGPAYAWLIPLPDGDLPAIDPDAAGLRRPWEGECCNTGDTEGAEDTDDTEVAAAPTPPLLLELSVLSVFSAPSVLQEEAVQSAIESTLPRSGGLRNRRLFDLARKLKAIPSLASADLPTLRPIIVEWHRRALPFIGTKEFTTSWGEFIAAWGKVKFPAGEGAIEEAFRRAMTSQPPAKAVALYDEPPILLLATLCRELQHIAGRRPFYLDCRTAGRLLGIHHTTAWRLLTVLCTEGILAPGEKGSLATRKATEYRYVAD
jgi:hypothetical protein